MEDPDAILQDRAIAYTVRSGSHETAVGVFVSVAHVVLVGAVIVVVVDGVITLPMSSPSSSSLLLCFILLFFAFDDDRFPVSSRSRSGDSSLSPSSSSSPW